ncbi:MAG TPA: histidine kinase [Bacteroidales bacterium]|nr:histidine kinase [Bacteroidales bacterium]
MSNPSRKLLTPTMHVIVWALIFYSPVMFSNAAGKVITLREYLHFVAIPISHMIVFYINYFIFIDLFLFKRKQGRFLLSNLLLILLVTIALHLWNESFGRGEGPDHMVPPLLFIIIRDTIVFSLTASLSVALKVTSDWYRKERQQQELEREKSATELKNLKNQLNPHFLFNTLNNIYSLTATNQQEAQYAILSLSKLLRYVLYDNDSAFIPLSKEISFIQSYIELMSLRLSDKVKITVSLPEIQEGKEIMIAPLLFITLIENAFKHGVSPGEESVIDISIKMDNENKLICKIINTCFQKNEVSVNSPGIGLENLKKRLALIYPGKYSLMTNKDEKYYISLLIINL